MPIRWTISPTLEELRTYTFGDTKSTAQDLRRIGNARIPLLTPELRKDTKHCRLRGLPFAAAWKRSACKWPDVTAKLLRGCNSPRAPRQGVSPRTGGGFDRSMQHHLRDLLFKDGVYASEET